MVEIVFGVNLTIFFVFLILYAYQMYYLYVGWKDKKKQVDLQAPSRAHDLAILVSARNEEAVIGELLRSIQMQNYPKEHLRVVLVADNCTDRTAEVARSFGATVYERNNLNRVGKGYALQFAFDHILNDETAHDEAFIILDADNLLDENYVQEMNRMFDQGYQALTSYRNSKNYAQNWLTAGYGLWFLREAEYLNRPRFVLGTSCAISGTGFLISAEIIRRQQGWHYHTLTEDIEFSVSSVLLGTKIGYAGRAVLYDEQPFTFKQSWRQRLRWAKGFYQVMGKHGISLLKTVLGLQKNEGNRFSAYDMIMTIMPALFVTLGGIFFNLCMLLYAYFGAPEVFRGELLFRTSQAIGMSFFLFYLTLFLIGWLTTATEWNQILASKKMKIRSLFTFPIFMFTYIPIAITAIFADVEWKPIEHTVVKSIEDMKQE